MAKHNKKRNVGLIHEQLVRYVASSLIAKDNKTAEKVINIIANHFKPGTELYKEFRLFNALINVPVGNKSIAERVLIESRLAAQSHDAHKLEKEKSLLIKDINTQLNESTRFYDIKIDHYRLLATVQTMLNEWRGKEALSLTDKAKYQESIIEWLSRQEEKNLNESIDTDPLVRKLMYQKFEQKYSDKLSNKQKKILETSILGSDEEFVQIIKETKKECIQKIESLKHTNQNKMLLENVDSVKEKIQNLEEVKNDDVISKTLHIIYLIEEIDSHD